MILGWLGIIGIVIWAFWNKSNKDDANSAAVWLLALSVGLIIIDLHQRSRSCQKEGLWPQGIWYLRGSTPSQQKLHVLWTMTQDGMVLANNDRQFHLPSQNGPLLNTEGQGTWVRITPNSV